MGGPITPENIFRRAAEIELKESSESKGSKPPSECPFLLSPSAFTVDTGHGKWEVSLNGTERSDGGILYSLPLVSYTAGLGEGVDASISFETLSLSGGLAFGDTNGSGDVRMRLRVIPYSRDSSRGGFMMGIKLPNANDSKGLGTDGMNFHFGLLMARKWNRFAASGRLGLGIMSKPDIAPDPVLNSIPGLDFGLLSSVLNRPGQAVYQQTTGQADVLDFGLNGWWLATERLSLAGELTGFLGNNGTYDDMILARAGLAWRMNKRYWAGLFVGSGVGENNPGATVSAGFSTFH